jgi:hypothetical protein
MRASSRSASLFGILRGAVSVWGAALAAQVPAPATAPVLDPKVPLPARFQKTAPDLTAKTLSVRLRTEIQQLRAEESLRLHGSNSLFAVGTRIADKADLARNPEQGIAHVLDKQRGFEIPVLVKRDESARHAWWYEPFGQSDAGHAITSLVSPSHVVLASKYAIVTDRHQHGEHPVTVLCSQAEVVLTDASVAYAVRATRVDQHRYAGPENGGLYSGMDCYSLAIVQRSFAADGDDGEVCALVVHRLQSKLYGPFQFGDVEPPKGHNQVVTTEGTLLLFLVCRDNGAVEAYGDWAAAKRSLPEKFVTFLDGDLRRLVDQTEFVKFFTTSTLPVTRLTPVDGAGPATGKPRDPVDKQRMDLEGAVFVITAAHATLNESQTLGVLSPAFRPSAVRSLQRDVLKSKKGVKPWLAGSGPDAKLLQEVRIGDLLVTYDKVTARPARALVCGAKGFVPVFGGKPSPATLLADATRSAFGLPAGEVSGLPAQWLQMLLALNGVPPAEASRVAVTVEFAGEAPAKPPRKRG